MVAIGGARKLMATGLVLTGDERAALAGQPWGVRWLYVEIRARMDWQTGLVGATRGAGVSYQAFTEWLYVEPEPGVGPGGSPSKAQVRRMVDRLERAGLVRNETSERRLVLRCLLAKVGRGGDPGGGATSLTAPSSVQSQAVTRPSQGRQTESDAQAVTQAVTDKHTQNPRNANVNHAVCDTHAGTQPVTQAITRPSDDKETQAVTPQSSVLCGGSSKTVENSPSTHVDRSAWWATFAGLDAAYPAADFRGVAQDPVVQRLVEDWSARGGTGADLCAVVGTVMQRERHPQRITAAYLAPMMAERLSKSPGDARGGSVRSKSSTGWKTEEESRAERVAEASERARQERILGISREEGEELVLYLDRLSRAWRLHCQSRMEQVND